MSALEMVPVHGGVAAGFEPVEEAFRSNFLHRNELGAACVVYLDGQKVIDLWGGYRDRAGTQAWESDTVVPVFSTSKGMAAMAIALAHSRGLLDYAQPVASYWPEFAQAGKADITVGQLVSHQAGVSLLNERVSPALVRDADALADVLARQEPVWEPGTHHGYHPITLGWYESELIRRVDPQHRRLGDYFRDEIGAPLDIDFHTGLPSDYPVERIAELHDFSPWRVLLNLRSMQWRFVRGVLTPWSLTSRSLTNPWVARPGDIARTPWREVEIPASNGIGSARAIAKAYSEFATGGRTLGLKAETLELLSSPSESPSGGDMDLILKTPTRYAFGFTKPFESFAFGPPTAFGAPGLGGSFGFADPDRKVGFAYTPNRCGFRLWDDPREVVLREAFYDCLRQAELR